MIRPTSLLLAVTTAFGCAREPEVATGLSPRGLMDRPVAASTSPEASVDPALEVLKASAEVWFLDRPFQPWNVFPTSPPEETPQRWRGVPTMPVSTLMSW